MTPNQPTTQSADQATTNPIEQLYQQYAGRASDPGGLEYWANQFGSEIDPTETATFQRAIAEGAAKGLESNVPAASYNPYFATNPDVAAAYTQNTYGMTPEQFAQTHYQQYGANEGRSAPTSAFAQVTQAPPSDYVSPSSIRGGDADTGPAADNPPGFTPSSNANVNLPLELTYHTGKTYKGDELLSLVQELAAATDTGSLRGGVYGEVGGNIGFAAEQAQKLFGANTNAANQVLLDAAANLLDKGVTSLSQLKYGDITGEANVVAKYDDDGRIAGYRAYYGNDGEGNYAFSRDLTPEEAAQVKTRQIETGEGSYTAYEPISTVVGKGIVGPDGKTVSDSSQLNIGSTYTGPGGTFYTLTIDPSTGKPAFSTFGQSSSDIDSIAPILTFLSFVPGPVGVAAKVANAAIAVDQGNEIGAILNLLGAGSQYFGDQLVGLTTPGSSTAVSGLDLASDIATTGTNQAIQLQNTLSNINLAKTGVAGLNALATGNVPGVINAALSGYTQTGGVLPSGVTTAVQIGNFATAINKGDLAGAGNVLADLTQSKDLRVASAAADALTAINSGDISRIVSAGQNFANTVSGAQTTGKKTEGKDVVSMLQGAGLSEIEDFSNLFANKDKLQGDVVDVADLTTETQVAGELGPGMGPRKITPNQLVTDTNGLPKFIGVIDYNTGATVPAEVKQDKATGKYYYTIDGETKIVSPESFERAFYKANPSEYLRMVNEIYATSGDIEEINRKLRERGFSGDPNVRSQIIDVEAREVPTDTKPTTTKTAPSVLDMLRSVGGGEAIEIGAAVDLSKKIPELREIMDRAQNEPYLKELMANLAKNPTVEAWRDEYKNLTGKDYDPAIADLSSLKDLGEMPEMVVTGKRIPADGSKVETFQDMTNDQFFNWLERNVINPAIAQKADTGAKTVSPAVTTTTTKIPPAVTQAPVVTSPTTGSTSGVPPVASTVTTTPAVPSVNPPGVQSPTQPPVTPVVTAPSTKPPTEPPVTPPAEPTVAPPEEPLVTSPKEPSVAPPTEPPVAPPVTPAPAPVKPSVPKLDQPSTTTGFTMPQAQAVAATFGLPQLANVFYYGKDFGSKKQKLKDGEVEEEEYKPLSVTKAGAVGEAFEDAEIAEARKTKENDVNGLIDQILGKSEDSVSLDELLNIVKGA